MAALFLHRITLLLDNSNVSGASKVLQHNKRGEMRALRESNPNLPTFFCSKHRMGNGTGGKNIVNGNLTGRKSIIPQVLYTVLENNSTNVVKLQ